jgi:hypothetical protein
LFRRLRLLRASWKCAVAPDADFGEGADDERVQFPNRAAGFVRYKEVISGNRDSKWGVQTGDKIGIDSGSCCCVELADCVFSLTHKEFSPGIRDTDSRMTLGY